MSPCELVGGKATIANLGSQKTKTNWWRRSEWGGDVFGACWGVSGVSILMIPHELGTSRRDFETQLDTLGSGLGLGSRSTCRPRRRSPSLTEDRVPTSTFIPPCAHIPDSLLYEPNTFRPNPSNTLPLRHQSSIACHPSLLVSQSKHQAHLTSHPSETTNKSLTSDARFVAQTGFQLPSLSPGLA